MPRKTPAPVVPVPKTFRTLEGRKDLNKLNDEISHATVAVLAKYLKKGYSDLEIRAVACLAVTFQTTMLSLHTDPQYLLSMESQEKDLEDLIKKNSKK